jgi:hypothetical protein
VRVLGFQQIASHFRDGIDKGEGDLSRRFDLARFSDFIGLRPLERVILAASIVATPTGKELATQASSIIQVEFHNAVCALSFEPSDLSRDQIEKLLSDLLSKPPTGPPVLDATQRETLIVAAQSKYGKDTINPMVQQIHPSLRYFVTYTPGHSIDISILPAFPLVHPLCGSSFNWDSKLQVIPTSFVRSSCASIFRIRIPHEPAWSSRSRRLCAG